VGNDQDMHDTFEQVRIREALQQIPTQQRIVIDLAFWGGMSHQEIALHCCSCRNLFEHMGSYRMSNYCEIVVKGQLDTDWSGWLEGLAITRSDRGETIISGQIRDQAAFYGLLAKMRDMALFLISVKYLADKSLKENEASDNNL
jgi:hypothetical protein